MTRHRIASAVIVGGFLFFLLFSIVSKYLLGRMSIGLVNFLAYATYFVAPLAAALISRKKMIFTSFLTASVCIVIAFSVFRIAIHPHVDWHGILVTAVTGIALGTFAGGLASLMGFVRRRLSSTQRSTSRIG